MVEERAWMIDLLWHSSPSSGLNPSKKLRLPSWHIRMRKDDLQNWRTKIRINSLFFDDASKGNPGILGAGGVIFDSKGNTQKEYAWGIGRETNNGTEWYTLIKGLKLYREMGVEAMSVTGDSLIVIRESRNISRNRKSPSSKMHHLLFYLVK